MLNILCVNIEEQVVFLLLFKAVTSVIVVVESSRIALQGLLTIRIIGTEVGVEAEVFETVDLVISFQVTYKLT